MDTALTLRRATADAYGGCYFDDLYCSDYIAADDAERAIGRLTEFIPYFDQLAAGLGDRQSSRSRGLSEERDFILPLAANLR